MIIIFVVLFAIALVFAEKYWAVPVMKRLTTRCRCSKVLLEPGETFALECETRNEGKLPAMFVRVNMYLPQGTSVTEAADGHVVDSGYSNSLVEMKFSLKGRSKVRRNINMSVGARGVYHVGKLQLGVGDLLGLNENSVFCGDETKIVVMPEMCRDEQVHKVVGGFIGDISVRRFIMEDPILTRGFRDYTGHEPFRDVSWVRTAVSGKLMVKEYDHTSDVNVMILLNLDTSDDEEIERCYSLTRTVCHALEKANIEYGLRTNGGLFGPVGYTEWFPQGLGERHYDTIMYSLGNARKVAYYSFDTLIEKTIKKQRNNENYIVIVPRAKAENARSIRKLEMKTGNRVCLLNASKEAT